MLAMGVRCSGKVKILESFPFLNEFIKEADAPPRVQRQRKSVLVR